MKNRMLMLLVVSLCGVGLAANGATTVFWDDMEDESHNEDNPLALTGQWGSENDDDGRAIEYAQEGISAPAGGGSYGMKISRRYGASTYAKAAIAAGGANPTVHVEYDYYLTDNSNAYTVFGLTANEDFASAPYRPDAGWAPNLAIRGPDDGAPNVQNLYNSQGPWVDGGTTPAMAKPAMNTWHKFEFDYTVGDDTSMTFTVNGTAVNVPGPWGWDALGATGHGDNRGPVDAITGAIWYNNGGAGFGTAQYVDNVLMTIVPEPATAGLLLGGAVVLAVCRRRKN